jgi:hypothetical protein
MKPVTLTVSIPATILNCQVQDMEVATGPSPEVPELQALHGFTWGHRVLATDDTVITKASFVDESTQAWSIVKTDSQGKILREVTGRSLRRNVTRLHAA